MVVKKRITVEDVQRAFAVTGLKPGKHRWCNDGAACGIGALMVEQCPMEHIRDGRFNDHIVKSKLGLELLYISLFTRGWDGALTRLEGCLPEEIEAYEDGRAAAKAMGLD